MTLRRRRRRHLTFKETFALEAVGFDDDNGAPFESWDDAREAWEGHRDRLMARAETRHPGDRPIGYWVFDVKRPDLLGDLDEEDWRKWDAWQEKRIEWLREHGQLRPDEEQALRKDR